MLRRWLLACTVDYVLLVGAVLAFALGWPGGRAPVAAVALIVLSGLLYQPLGEVLGGTLGQRWVGIRLTITNGTPFRTACLRHGYRMGIVWGVAAALEYWWLHRQVGWEWSPRTAPALAPQTGEPISPIEPQERVRP